MQMNLKNKKNELKNNKQSYQSIYKLLKKFNDTVAGES